MQFVWLIKFVFPFMGDSGFPESRCGTYCVFYEAHLFD